MAFSGTLQKCKACDKTVYVVDLLSADGVPYHKTCFKCSHCRGQLVISNYSSLDGVLYCKPHFEQLFKETGSFSKNFQTTPKSQEQSRTPSKVSSMFSGTQDKCATCHKTAYPLEKLFKEKGSYNHLIKTTSIKRKQDQGPPGQTQEEQTTADDEAPPPDEAPPETLEQSS
ncbi:hypothetical protein MRB53_004599 [Persea americana]|uniref:Uncharacterized protein n=1 Tax=Persea americana TaxID=3435 RepID=A0ACC2MAP4_PERAE|nr:hypothetical protein MRB53_004599 [Persea americana]